MVRYSVTIPPRVAAGLRRLAATSAPMECRGALIGTADRDSVELRTLIPIPVAHGSRQLIDPKTLLRLQRQAASVRLQLVGFFRSSPTGSPIPAVADLELAHAGLLYIIVGAHDGSLRVWRMDDHRRDPIELPLLSGAA